MCTTDLHWCWRLWTFLNLDNGCSSCTLIGPKTGLRWRKNRYLPDRECWTAFSMNSTMVLLLNLVKVPKLKFPETWRGSRMSHREKHTFQSFLTLIVLYPNVPDLLVEFEGQREDVVIVAGIPDKEGSVGFVLQESLGCSTRDRTPIPAALRGGGNWCNAFYQMLVKFTHIFYLFQ